MKKAILLITLILAVVLSGCDTEKDVALDYKNQKNSEADISSEISQEKTPETTPDTTPQTVPEKQPETTPDTTPQTVPEKQPETVPETNPEPVQQVDEKAYGIAFLGFGEGYNDVDLSLYLPVIEHNGVGTIFLEGHSFFLLIPANEDIFFEIYGVRTDDKGKEIRWQESETYPGTPVLIRCNDWYDPPSALVKVCGTDEEYEFFTPTYLAKENKMQLEDGAFNLETIE